MIPAIPRLLGLSLLSVIATCPLSAQQWDISLGAARSLAAAPTSDATALAPIVALSGRSWRAGTEWNSVAAGGRTMNVGRFSSALLGPTVGPFRTEVVGDLQTPLGDLPTDARLAARLHLAGPARGLWLGAGPARTLDEGALLRSAGGWMQGSLGTLSVRIDQTVGSTAGHTGGIIDTLHTTSLRIQSLMAHYATPSGRLELTLGSSSTNSSIPGARRATTGLATWWVGRAIALVGGYAPSAGNGFVPAAGAARFGLIWRPRVETRPTYSLVEPAALAVASVEPVGAGRWLIRLPARGAQGVEVEGSFSDWAPIPLHAAEPGWWEVTIPLPAGRHELTWRRDGGTWNPLPGLPAVNDDLLGKVSVVVIGGGE